MDKKAAKIVWFTLAWVLTIGVIIYARNVFLLAFAGILLAILLNVIGSGAKKITHFPYSLALVVALVFIAGLMTLLFWLYSPLIADQLASLSNELPKAVHRLHSSLSTFLGPNFIPQHLLQNEFSLTNEKVISSILSLFSTTVGSLAGFVVFIFVGFYLAFSPKAYIKWLQMLIPGKRQTQVTDVMGQIGNSLRWWLLGKLFSMVVVGIASIIGLSLLHVSLAFILGFLAGLLTFIPYVGSIIAAIPAILIAFMQSPLKALYVMILYVGIHIVDGYFITPNIEQRTVQIPPAVSIMGQMLAVVLIGGVGLALATPLIVVAVGLIQYSIRE